MKLKIPKCNIAILVGPDLFLSTKDLLLPEFGLISAVAYCTGNYRSQESILKEQPPSLAKRVGMAGNGWTFPNVSRNKQRVNKKLTNAERDGKWPQRAYA